MKKLFLILVFIIACQEPPVPQNKDITVNDIYSHISLLASDKMEGRRAGTKFEKLAGEYIAKCFNTYGLIPIKGRFIQEFNFIAGMDIGDSNYVASDNSKVQKSDFITLSFSSSGQVIAPLVFAGYGIIAHELNYDDYEGLDVKGKIVIVLRYSPDGDEKNGKFSQYSSLRYKAMTARENGASGIIFVTGALEDNDDDILKKGGSLAGKQSVGISAVHIKRNVIDEWLSTAGYPSIEELQNKINGHGNPAPAGFNIKKTITLSTDINPELLKSRNVAGSIPGKGTLKDEWVILGAHMDHLGWGGEGSNSMVPELHEIHNGADDNASGVAALLELADYFSQDTTQLGSRRSLLFITFGAEEIGLLGSAYYVEHPLVPLGKTEAMFNMDMVGRLRENKMVIGGYGTSASWETLLAEVNADSIDFTFDEEGFGSSDHQSFYLKNIPVLFFFTGAHEDYHKPTDDISLLNFPGIKKVTELVARATQQVLITQKKPEFIKVKSKKHSGRGGYNVTFGIIPDFMYSGDGFKISGVREMAPAGRAGMQAGDIIISINNINVMNIYDYMYALQNCNVGVEVPVVIQRGQKRIEMNIAPQGKED